MLRPVNHTEEGDKTIKHSLILLQRRRFAKLRCGRLVQVEANDPDTCAVQHLQLLLFCRWLLLWKKVQVQVGCDASVSHQLESSRAALKDGGGVPNSEARIQPAAILFPAARRNSVDTHEYVSLTQFDRFPAVNERISRGALREVHRDRVHFRLIRIARGDGANYSHACNT